MRASRLEDPPKPQRVTRLCVSSAARPVNGPPDPRSDAEAEYQSSDGASMTTNLPIAKAAILQLASAGHRRCRSASCSPRSGLRCTAPTSEDAATLAGLLMKIYSSGLLDLHLVPSRFTLRVSERPRAFSLARLQARSGSRVTTLRHSTVEIEDALGLRLVTLLDGTRDRTRAAEGSRNLRGSEPAYRSLAGGGSGQEPQRAGAPGSSGGLGMLSGAAASGSSRLGERDGERWASLAQAPELQNVTRTGTYAVCGRIPSRRSWIQYHMVR